MSCRTFGSMTPTAGNAGVGTCWHPRWHHGHAGSTPRALIQRRATLRFLIETCQQALIQIFHLKHL